jgi:hypothetical protein
MARVRPTTTAQGMGLSGACFSIVASFEHAGARRGPRAKKAACRGRSRILDQSQPG